MTRKAQPQNPALALWLPRIGRTLLQLSKRPFLEWLLLAAALLPFVLISAFNHPTDDDFQGAVLARHLSFWESIGFYYLHWTGRYTSNFLYGLVYEVSDLKSWLLALRVAPILFLATLLTAGWFAIGGLTTQLGNAAKWRYACYGLILYLYGIPLTSSALYWFSGSAVYTSGIVLTLLLVGVAGRYTQASSTLAEATWGSLGAGTAFLLVGTNELFILIALVGLICWLCYPPSAPKRRRLWPVVLLVAAMVGAIITLAAPGNMARAAMIPSTVPFAYRVLITCCKAAYLVVVHLVRWGTDGILLLATGLFMFSLRQQFKQVLRRQWLWLGLIGGVLMAALLIPTLWLTNDIPARIWNVVYFVFLITWFAVATSASGYLPSLPAWPLFSLNKQVLRVAWLLLVLLGHDKNVHQAYIDLVFKSRAYDVAQHQRYQQLQQAHQQGRSEAVVPSLLLNEYQYPSTIFLHELELSPHDIANEGMAAYFGLDSVRVSSLPQRTKGHFRE